MKFACKLLTSCLVGSFALLSSVAAAHAITVTNRDDKDHKLTIIEGEAKADHALKANAALEHICMKGCVVRLNDSENDEYELEGTEVVSIEDGYLYYDGPDVPSETPPAAAAPGATPPAPTPPGAQPKPQ